MKICLLAFILMFTFSTQVYSHSGGLDKQGGHNCSDESKRKNLCSGYHYHRAATSSKNAKAPPYIKKAL